MNHVTKSKRINMSEILILKDVGNIWSRIFDQKVFLSGEIQFFLKEFEQNRSDIEIVQLFSILEKATDIRDSQIDQLKKVIDFSLPKTSSDLSQALSLCNNISDLEQTFKEDTFLALAREDRKLEWESFVDSMASKCSQVDNTFIEKQGELEVFYKELEKKLYTTHLTF